MSKNSNHSVHRHHKKDDADNFRESSLRAIHRRKVLPKIRFRIMLVVTLAVVAFAFYCYYAD